MTLGMNDCQPCGTEARRTHHRAHAQLCVVCFPDVEWMRKCPHCHDAVPVKGTTVQPHAREGTDIGCTGAGLTVPAPPLNARPIWPYGDADRPWRSSPAWAAWRSPESRVL